MAFSLNLETIDGIPVFVLNGYVDKEAARQILEAVAAQQKTGLKRFVLDFAAAPLVNSSALAELIDLVSQGISDTALRFVFCGLSPTCRFSFNTIGIFHYARPAETRAEALQAATAP